MQRTLVISDIHGELNLFEQLLNEVNYQPEQDQLILLGDYVDRGPNAKLVIEKVMELKQLGALVLKGNHEDLMIKALTTNDERTWKNWTRRNGGDQTLQSYGFHESEYAVSDDEPFTHPKLQSETLKQHLNFIQNLDFFFETNDTIFVHGGVHPTIPLTETDPYTLMWIREEFHKGYIGDKTVIFGHTPTKHLHKDIDNHTVYFGGNRIIGIDGGAVYGGQLNCLELPKQVVYFVKSKRTHGGIRMENKKYQELIPKRIFIGGVDDVDNLLMNETIDVIYDLRAEVKGPLSSDKSIHQPIVDDADKQDDSIKEATQQVVDAYHAGKNVYLHCNTGRGRAGTIATAVLLELGLADSVDEAEQKAKEIRPNINVKPPFKEALQRIYTK